MQPRQEIDCPEFSEESIIAHRRLGLFDRGRKRPLKLALMNKWMVSDVVKKVKILATHEEYKEIWIKECVS